MSTGEQEKTFILHAPTRDLDTYRAVARAATRLKPYGRVQVNISALADKSWHEMPAGGSSWHEYASHNPTPYKFFPHPKIAPHLPEAFVAGNRELLMAKAAILREEGLEASFWGVEPNHLPESFFDANPHLRGPRVDHPRRSRAEAFAMCVDLEESLDIVSWMVAELKRSVPELGTFAFKTNDAGAGLCWAAAQYPGPNGPRHCRHRSVGERVRGLMEAIHRGAEAGGGPIDVRLAGNFWGGELDIIRHLLPPRSCLAGRDSSAMRVGSLLATEYPVLGLVDTVAILESMERFALPQTRTVFLDFRASYDRAGERVQTIEKVIEIVEDCIKSPSSGFVSRVDRLQALAACWAGDASADALVEAFHQVNQSLQLRRAVAARVDGLNAGVSLRHITRPLVIKPALLTPEEESYFLPYVFNIHESEARNDYLDLHGTRTGMACFTQRTATRIPALQAAVDGVLQAARAFESVSPGRPAVTRTTSVADPTGRAAPDASGKGAWLPCLGKSLRLWASITRSCGNFALAQAIRDRNREAIDGGPRRPDNAPPAEAPLARRLVADPTGPRIPEKVPTHAGHPDFIPFNEIMRDELDNTNELIALLESGGLEFISRAVDARYEDTFLLGPDLVGQLRRKAKIMRDHWRDIERYLASPHR